MNWPLLSNVLRRVIHGLALALFVFGGLVLALTILYPRRWDLGFAVVSLRSVGYPSAGMVVAFCVWQATARRLGPIGRWIHEVAARLRTAWHGWRWNRRLLFVIVAANLVMILVMALNYPGRLARDWAAIHKVFGSALVGDANDPGVSLEHFARRCRDELPPDARILYHGHLNGMLFSYEVYPRQVFMLPGERYEVAAGWHKQRWLEDRGEPDESLEAYWVRDFPDRTVDRETFLRRQRITHEVFFDEDDITLCRIEAIR